MITQLFNSDVLKILTVFSISPGSRFYRKELKERAQLHNVNLDNGINILLNSKIITKKGRFLLLNFDNENTKRIIYLVSSQYKFLKEIPLNVYFPIIDIVSFLSRFRFTDVYLFGSFAKLVFEETSDVDIAVVSDRIHVKEKRDFGKLIQKFEARYGKKIEVHYFGKDFYKNRKDPFVREILKNGVKLL